MNKLITYFLLLSLSACGSVARQTGNRPVATAAPSPTRTQQNQSWEWTGQMDVTNTKRYRKFLRDYQICDPWSLINFGTSSCEAWDNNAYVTLIFNQKKLPTKVTFQIQPVLQHWSAGSRPIPHFVPIAITGEARYIDDYDGFQARFTGRVGLGAISPVVIKSSARSDGSIYKEDITVDVDFFYGSTAKDNFQFGSAELTNSQYAGDETSERRR